MTYPLLFGLEAAAAVVFAGIGAVCWRLHQRLARAGVTAAAVAVAVSTAAAIVMQVTVGWIPVWYLVGWDLVAAVAVPYIIAVSVGEARRAAARRK